MIRTVISLDKQEKAWLENIAKAKRVSMAQIIRLAIKEYHKKNRHTALSSIDILLNQTKDIWPAGEGLKYQKKIRDEWRSK